MLDLTRLTEAVRYERGISRRLFVAFATALAATPTLATRVAGQARKPRFAADPFSLGVASGDPTADGVVLWTRLAPMPLEKAGGMTDESVEVHWEIADDEGMRQVVKSGTAVAASALGHSLHVEVAGLKPDRWYFYRFRAGDATSPVGRTRTAPEPTSTPDRMRFAFVSCQHFEQGLFTGYRRMAEEELDLVVHLGDYIYEGPGVDKRVRKHAGPAKTKILTLEDYRNRHAQYRGDALLQAAHARCPWLVTWDDHEFDNNYANDISEKNDDPKKAIDPAKFLIQRAAAYQAYYEAMPLRAASVPAGPRLKLYRTVPFGRLASFQVLDTRQYRTDQPHKDKAYVLDDEALSPKNTLLGKEQAEWLKASLGRSTATWNVLAQQVMMGLVHRAGTGKQEYSMDQWPGAAYERMRLVEWMAERRISNPVVLTGDIHSNWVNDLRIDDRKPETPVVATEFVGTSISSGGNGKEGKYDAIYSENACVRFHNRQRGYVSCEVTPTTWRSDYQIIDDVEKPGGGVGTLTSFVVEAGRPGATPA